MQLVILNTGESRPAPREDVPSHTLEALRPIIVNGGPIPDRPGYSVHVDRLAGGATQYTVTHRRGPLFICGLAWNRSGDRKLWPQLVSAYHQVYSPDLQAAKPDVMPWLGVLMMPPVLFGHSSGAWLEEFGRCFAWAILDDRMLI